MGTKKIGPKEAAAKAQRAVKAGKKQAPKKTAPKKEAKGAAKPKRKAPPGAGQMDPAEEAKLQDAIAKAAARAAKKGGKPALKADPNKPGHFQMPDSSPADFVSQVAVPPVNAKAGKAAKAPKQPKPAKDWTVKPIIKSETNKSAQQLIDRIEAASKAEHPKKELAAVLASFKPCNTYYKMAHRYGTALLAAT